MDVGIVGLAGSGRTTVFRALLAHRAPQQAGARHGGGAIGTIHVQDPRLEKLFARFQPKKMTPVEIHVHDLCPLLERSFPTAEIEAMKRMELLLLVIPAFADPSEEAITAAFERLLGELCLEDLAAVEKRLWRAPREKLADIEQEALEIARTALDGEKPVIAAPLSEPQRQSLRGYALVTDRCLIALANVAEDAAGEAPPEALQKRAGAHGIPVLALCGTLEAEMAELPPAERAPFLAEYGIQQPASAVVTRAILDCADLIPFFTMNEDECRAWPIRRGTSAREAAGKIHSDMERGFIRAEVVAVEDLVPLEGGFAEARKLAKLRVEGKDYLIQDGEVVQFRFNV
jgi:ribosome-binding ATPase YchF (GTP1/OBG family)